MKNSINRKKILLIVSLWMFAFCVQAQLNGNRYFFKLEGGYSDESSSNLLTIVNAYESRVKSGDVGISFGHSYSDWIMGVGFEYASAKSATTGLLVLGKEEFNGENTEVSIKRSLAKAFVGYNFLVLKNLYFTPTLYCGYGESYGDVERMYVRSFKVSIPPNELGPITPSFPIVEFKRTDISMDCLSFQLAPELSYFFSQHFGCNLQMGGAIMEVNDNSWRNKQTVFSFSPKYWRVGIIVGF